MCKIKIHNGIDNDTVQQIYCQIQVDYFGNIFLKYRDDYYLVFTDCDSETGVSLTKIKNPDRFRKNLIDNAHLPKCFKSGKIQLSSQTLKGRVNQSLNDMDDEEREEYMLKNNFYSNDPNYREKEYFWVSYDDKDEPLEDEEDDGYYLNGVISPEEVEEGEVGIVHSDLLMVSPGSFDTILISGSMDSKHVVSTCERIDGYCVTRLTIWTDGLFRCNFVESEKVSKLSIDSSSDELTVIKV